jgi:hypothetical protein
MGHVRWRQQSHRLGHASPTAALRYQHATVERDRSIAEALGRLIATEPDPEVLIECEQTPLPLTDE